MFLTVCLNPTIQKTLRFKSVVPCTVNRTAHHRLDVSGKGINVTRVLTQLGKKAVHLTQLGPDSSAGNSMKPLFLALCEQDGLSIEWVESESQIRFCYTLLTDDSVTELVEESQPVAAGTEERLIKKFDALLSDSASSISCLIISGTKAAGFSDKVFPYMTKKAKQKGMRIILDIKGTDLIECLKFEPDIVKPNLYEFAVTFKPELIKDNDVSLNDSRAEEIIKSAVIDITKKYKCSVILTNGSRKILASDKERFLEIDVPAVKAGAASAVQNSIGCGDAFTAGLAAALEDGAAFEAAVKEGTRCGALNAGLEKPGCIVI